MRWSYLPFLPLLTSAAVLQKVIRVRDTDGLGLSERVVRLTTEEWSRCLFYNESLTMQANRPVVVYDAAYRAMRRLGVDEGAWDSLLDLRDAAEDLDTMRFGTHVFDRFGAHVTMPIAHWLERLTRDLREMVWISNDHGDPREFRRRLRGLRDMHVDWVHKRMRPSSNACMYFIWNQTEYME